MRKDMSHVSLVMELSKKKKGKKMRIDCPHLSLTYTHTERPGTVLQGLEPDVKSGKNKMAAESSATKACDCAEKLHNWIRELVVEPGVQPYQMMLSIGIEATDPMTLKPEMIAAAKKQGWSDGLSDVRWGRKKRDDDDDEEESQGHIAIRHSHAR